MEGVQGEAHVVAGPTACGEEDAAHAHKIAGSDECQEARRDGRTGRADTRDVSTRPSSFLDDHRPPVPTAKRYVVYVLRSTTRPGRTYVGCTNDPAQRIRRHNGEICGGARYTRVGRPWCYALVVRGFGLDKCAALSFEWHLKRRSRRRVHPRGLSALERRSRGLRQLLALPRWAARDLTVEPAQ